jgi:hypothetical protein
MIMMGICAGQHQQFQHDSIRPAGTIVRSTHLRVCNQGILENFLTSMTASTSALPAESPWPLLQLLCLMAVAGTQVEGLTNIIAQTPAPETSKDYKKQQTGCDSQTKLTRFRAQGLAVDYRTQDKKLSCRGALFRATNLFESQAFRQHDRMSCPVCHLVIMITSYSLEVPSSKVICMYLVRI